MTKLLPFWRRAFEAASTRPLVVFVFRNPASVAASLHKRDKLSLPHGYLLWASHMLECFRHARHFAHIFINYDAFIDNPGEGIAAIADCFRLPVDMAEFTLIERDFLDKKLRHTKFDAGYLYTDAHCPPGVALAYERMLRIPPDGRPGTGDCLELTRILRACLQSGSEAVR